MGDRHATQCVGRSGIDHGIESPVSTQVVAESVEKSRHVDAAARGSRSPAAQARVAPGGGTRRERRAVLDRSAQAWALLRRFCAPTAPVSLTQITGGLRRPCRSEGRAGPVGGNACRRPRDKAELFLRDPQGEVQHVALCPNDAGGKQFVHAIDAADEAFAYRFRAGDGQTAWHDVAIYDRPRLTNVELRLTPPEYTHLPAVTKSELPTSLRAVEGSQLEVSFSVDQPLGRFDLQLGTDSSQASCSQAERSAALCV